MYGISLPTATTAAGGTATAASLSVNKSLFPSVPVKTRTKSSRRREIWLTKKKNFCVFASKEDEPKLDQYDQMELKFGRMIGEDPKLTLAKIMARKANPDVSYLEVEKSFYKNKGKVVEIKELPFDVSKYKRQSKPLDGLNLVRPTPKGVVFPTDEEPERPRMKKPNKPIGKDVDNSKRGFPNVILRKPGIFVEDDVEDKSSSRSRVRIQPNLRLKMRNDPGNEKFSDMTLLRKPEPVNVEEKQESLDKAKNGAAGLKTERDDAKYSSFTLLKKPETAKDDTSESLETAGSSEPNVQELEGEPELGMQPLENSDMEPTNEQSVERLDDSAVKFSVDASLQGKPMRLEQSAKSVLIKEDKSVLDPARYVNVDELKNLPSLSPVEDADWSRAEALYDTGNRGEVELVSGSTRGFIVSFGSLVGFLPYRNLVAKWKFLAFESWLKQKGLDPKGLDPSRYKQNLGIIGSYDVLDKNIDSSVDQEINKRIVGDITPDMKLEDLLRIYDQEKLKFLSSFVGQKVKVNVVVADRKLRKLTVSLRPKEKEELIQRKRSLMAKLQIGDIVKCCIKKITYFGIFVEVEGVPALIHQTEVSWDATLDPASYFKVGQIVEAKVHRLDFTLERVFLSLKEITPDPLIEALESVVGDRDSLDGRLQAAEADSEWADVESLIKELQQTEGVESVSKGRFFLSPGLAPTFQVYMASMFKNQYKLLARSGNKVQEVIVEASLDKEEMKAAILSCTNRVE